MTAAEEYLADSGCARTGRFTLNVLQGALQVVHVLDRTRCPPSSQRQELIFLVVRYVISRSAVRTILRPAAEASLVFQPLAQSLSIRIVLGHTGSPMGA